MFGLICVAVILLLLIGRTRRGLLAAWRLILSLAVGLVVGVFVVRRMLGSNVPSWMVIVGPIVAAPMFCTPLQEILNELLGPPPRRKD